MIKFGLIILMLSYAAMVNSQSSYGRGVGVPVSTCPPSFDKIGLLCYPSCLSGYYAVALNCWSRCGSG